MMQLSQCSLLHRRVLRSHRRSLVDLTFVVDLIAALHCRVVAVESLELLQVLHVELGLELTCAALASGFGRMRWDGVPRDASTLSVVTMTIIHHLNKCLYLVINQCDLRSVIPNS